MPMKPGSALEIACSLTNMRDVKFPSEKNLEQVPKGVKLQTNLHTILSIYALPVKDIQHVPDRLILHSPSES